MNRKLLLGIGIFCMFMLSGTALAITPTLTLSLNAPEIIANTLAGNQIATATCTASDTCQILNVSGSVLATGTTTATVNINSLVLTSSGYVSLIGHDSSTPANSVTNVIRIIVGITNSTSLTFNNTQPVAYQTGTTVQLIISNLAFTQYETSCSDNNQVLYTTNGVVIPSWQQGNEINESNLNLCTAVKDMVLFSTPAGFLPSKSTNSLTLGWAAPGTNLLDGNYICQAPQLSTTYGQYDCGSKVFANYYTGGGGGGGTIASSFTNNAFTLTDAGNYISAKCTSAWCLDYIATPPALQVPYNGFEALMVNSVLIGTTNSIPSPDAFANQSVEEGFNCDPSNGGSALCINIGGGFGANTIGGATTNAFTYIYSFQPSIWTITNTSNIINVYKNQFTNWFAGGMILDNCEIFNGCTGAGGVPPQNPIVGNVEYFVNKPYTKGLIATNLSNTTWVLSQAKKDNFTSKDVIWLDAENFTSATYPFYELISPVSTEINFCNIVHAAGYKVGIYLLGDTPIGEFPSPADIYLDAGYMNQGLYSNSMLYSCFDYVNIQQQYFFNQGTAITLAANAIIENVTISNPIISVGVQTTLHDESLTPPVAPVANAVFDKQISNITASPSVTQIGINYLLALNGCRTTPSPACTPNLLANDINYTKSTNPAFRANAIQPELYQLAALGANTTLNYDNQWVQARTGTSGLYSPYFGFYLNNGKTANVFWIGVEILPPNDIQPTITLGTSGVLHTPSLTANYPTIGTSAKTEEFIANWSGGEGPYTANIAISNAISGALIKSATTSNLNATWYLLTNTIAANVQIKANVVVTDANGNKVNSTYIYLPAQIAVQNSITKADVGQTLLFQGYSSGGALLYQTYNVLYTITNSVTGTSMNTFAYNNIMWNPANTYSFIIPSSWAGNTVQANIIVNTGVINGNYLVQAPTAITINSPKLSTITISSALIDSWSASATSLDVGETQTLTATTDGGTGTSPWTYNILVYAANGMLEYNSLAAASASTSNVVSYIQNAAWGTGTFTANVFIKDSATVPVTISNTLTYTVDTALATPIISPSANSFIVGNTQTWTASWTGGTSTFTVNWIVSNTAGQVYNALYVGLSASPNSISYTPLALGAYNVNVVITDSASTKQTMASSNAILLVTSCPSATLPTSIVAYTCITLNNYNGSVTANTPLSFIFNALAYQTYESHTLNNTELFYANGTVANSWLEGNVQNEQQQTNTLYTSNDILYWFKSPSSPANYLASESANYIYLGFASTIASSSSLLWSSTVGVAPQLTCSNPASTAICSAGNGVKGIYGEYDNGNSIFSFYDNFAGQNINTNRWSVNSPSGQVSVSNSLTISSAPGSIQSLMPMPPANTIPQAIEAYSLSMGYNIAPAQFGTTNVILSTSSDYTYGNSHVFLYAGSSATQVCGYSSSCADVVSPSIISLFENLGTVFLYSNYVSNHGISVSPDTSNIYSNPIELSVENICCGNAGSLSIQLVRDRILPPNNTMPSSSFGTVATTAPSLSISSPSNAIADVGQYETFTATASAGVAPYTYNFIVINASSKPSFMVYVPQYNTYPAGWVNLLNNANIIYLSEEDMFVATISATGGLAYYGPPVFTDTQVNSVITSATNNGIINLITIGGSTQTPASINAILANTGGVQTALMANVVNALTTGKQLGTLPFNGVAVDFEENSGLFNSGANGILATEFLANLYSNVIAVNSNDYIACYVSENTNYSADTGYNYNAIAGYCKYFDWSANTGIGQLKKVATVVGGARKVRDNACLECGPPGEFNIWPTSYYLANVPTDLSNDIGISVFTSNSLTDGTNMTIVNAIASNAIKYEVITHNGLYSSVASDSNTFTFQTISADTANSQERATVIVSDSSNNNVTAWYSSLFTINPTLTTPTQPTPTSSESYDTGQTVTFSTTISGGTPNYIYKWIIANSVTKTILNTTIFAATSSTSNSFTFTMNSNLAGNTIYANVIVTDSATTNSIVNSINSGTITINKNMSVPTISPSSSESVDSGQIVSFISSFTGGTSSYTYKWQIYNSITKSILNTTIYSSVASTANTFAFTTNSNLIGNTIYANVLVTDNSQVPLSTNSILSGTITILTALGTPTLSPSNTILDSGQTETYTTSWSNGVAPFTVNLYNVTGSRTQNVIVSTSPSTNTFIVGATGTFQFNAIVKDSSASGIETTNSITNSITVNLALLAGAITPSSPSIDSGQSITLTSHTSQGTSIYTYKWYTNSVGNPNCNNANVISGQTGSTISVSPTTTNSYTYQVTDSATTNSIVCSAADIVTVNPALGIPSIAPSVPQSNNPGQIVTFATTASGGTLNFQYKWIIANSVTHTTLNTTTFSSVASASNSFAFTINSNLLGNTIYANVIVTDTSSAGNEITNSINSGTINVISGYTPPTIAISSPSNTIADVGQYETFTATVTSGGTSPFTYNFMVVNSVTLGTIAHNALYTGVAGTSNTFLFQTISADIANSQEEGNIILTDANPTTINTIYSAKFTINQALITGAITPSSPTIGSGQSITLTSHASQGTSAYTYKWYTNTNGNPICNNANVISGQTGSTISVSPTTTNSYTYQVTDSATTNSIVCSASDIITVNGILQTPTISPSSNGNAPINVALTFSATVTGGVYPLTYKWQIFNSVSKALLNTTIFTSVSSSVNSFAFTPNSNLVGNTIVANVAVTDSAFSPVTTNSIFSGVQNVISSSIPIYSFGSGVNLTYGSSTLISTTCSGSDNCQILIDGMQYAAGTGSATYNFITGSGAGNFGVGVYKIKFCDIITGACTPDPYISVFMPIVLRNAKLNPALTFGNTINGITICTTNFLGGTCQGNDTISGTQTLSRNLYVLGNLTINAGASLTTNGYSIVALDLFNNSGTINSGTYSNGGGGGFPGGNGGSLYNSFSGSGGGGGTYNPECATGGFGGNTLANGGAQNGGSGSSPSSPTLSNANVLLWFSNTINYLTGGGGGGGAFGGGICAGSPGNGGGGGYGLVIQASNVIAGTINLNGQSGTAGQIAFGFQGGGGGGGGAGTLIIVYLSGYTSGTYNINGGGGAAAGGGSAGIGKIITYNPSNAPISILRQFYPIQLYAQNSSTSITYTLNSIYQGIKTTYATNVLNLTFIPPANQPSGQYSYNIVETQGANSAIILANVSINMTDVNSILTYNTPIIQYFPNFVACPAWTETPTTWRIQSDMPGNNHQNQSTPCGDVWSNANVTFTPNVVLNYGWTIFGANILNNPDINTIIQSNFVLIASNTIPSSPNTRAIYNISSYDAGTRLALVANTNFSAYATFNNYTLLSSANFTANTFKLYIPLSDYSNPSIFLYNQSAISLAAAHFPEINNPFQININQSYIASLKVYLPSSINSNGTQYNVNAYQCNGYANNYTLIVQGGTPPFIQQQIYRMISIPFEIPLLTGIQYRFQVYNPSRALVFTQGPLLPTVTPGIVISIPCTSPVPPLEIPNITALCTSKPYGSNQLLGTCTAIDKAGYVKNWTVKWVAVTTLITSTTLNTINITNTSQFTRTYILPSNTTEYTGVIIGKGPLDDYPFSFILNTPKQLPFSAGTLFLTVILILLPVALAYFHKEIFIALEIVIVFIGQALGLLNFSAYDVTGIILCCIVVLVVDYMHRQRGG